jgi:hypothetical protein
MYMYRERERERERDVHCATGGPVRINSIGYLAFCLPIGKHKQNTEVRVEIITLDYLLASISRF